MRTVYRSVTAIGSKSGKCTCGIARKRSQTFSQTVNPWNKNPSGTIKNADDIRREVEAHRAAWMEAPIFCTACKPRAASPLPRPTREAPHE